MKKKSLYIFGVLLCLITSSYGQNINFPDPNLKKALLEHKLSSSGYGIIDTNGDLEISVAEAEASEVIGIPFKNITNLDGLEYFINLKTLLCSGNNITEIKPSLLDSLTSLQRLDITGNQIKSIDLRNNHNIISFRGCSTLEYVYAMSSSPYNSENAGLGLNYSGSILKYICMSQDQFDLTETIPDIPWYNSRREHFDRLKAAGIIHIDECNIQTPTCPIINFPDPNFKQALLNHSPVIDTDGDGEICIDEAEAVTNLLLEKKNINDINGIEHFINTAYINLNYNNVVTADLSNNLKIRQLTISNNKLTSLNLSNNETLENINAQYNQLTSIDLTTNINLKSFHLHNNQLTQLNVSNLINLWYIGAQNNLLTSLNTTNCLALNAMQISDNNIMNLDISTNTNLVVLQVQNNNLSELNITTNNSKLNHLLINNNLLKEIDIRNCNSIYRLDISNNPNLEKAYLTGGHQFYGSFNYFLDRTLSININYRNCPKLNFICVNNVSFFNDIKTYTTGMYPTCTVSTNCDSTLPVADFDTYFRLSPNPTTGIMFLTRKNSRINVIAADIYNAQTGAYIKTVDIFFEGDFLTPKENFKTTNTIQRIEEPISLSDSAFIDCNDIQRGTYILKVYSNKGTFSTTFIKSTEAIR